MGKHHARIGRDYSRSHRYPRLMAYTTVMLGIYLVSLASWGVAVALTEAVLVVAMGRLIWRHR